MKRAVILALISAFAFMFHPALGQADMGTTDSMVMGSISLTLNPTYSYSGYAHVANGIALRNEARGTIALRGIPLGSTLVKAWLYWNLSNTVAVGAASEKAYFNGNLVTGIKRADSTDPCWGMAGNHTYRGDVTNFISKTPNGDYEVVLCSAVSTSGQNPWSPSEAQTTRLEGATLIAIYRNSGTTNNKVVLYDSLSGSTFSGGTATIILNHGTTLAGTGLFTMTGADGQRGVGSAHTNGASNEIGKFNGAQISGPPVAASDWDGSAGWPLVQLWDVHTHQVTLSGSSSKVEYIASSDCLTPVAFVLQLGL